MIYYQNEGLQLLSALHKVSRTNEQLIFYPLPLVEHVIQNNMHRYQTINDLYFHASMY